MTWNLKIAVWTAACAALSVALAALPAHAEIKKSSKTADVATTEKRKPTLLHAKAQPAATLVSREDRDGQAEAQLIDIYKLIGQAKTRQALPLAERLVREQPNFQLAQLVYGDLLTAQLGPVRAMGNVPDTTAKAAAQPLAELRRESQLRLQALRERPAPGLLPSQLISLSAQNKHAIAIDTSR